MHFGTPLGDVTALTSINIVLAALLGRIFLGEDLRCVHWFSVLISTVGAVLISEPSFLFGESGNNGNSWIGYVLAPMAGLCNASVLICSRRCADVSFGYYMWSAQFWSSIIIFAMAYTPAVDDFSLAVTVQAPFADTLGWYMVLIGSISARGVMHTIGAKWCPVAASATIGNASSMVCSYLAQVLIFGVIPKPLALIGGALMLTSIFAMAAAPKKKAYTIDPAEKAGANADLGGEDDFEEALGTSSMSSLASFIAQECSEYDTVERKLRLRTLGNTTSPTTIGVMARAMPEASD